MFIGMIGINEFSSTESLIMGYRGCQSELSSAKFAVTRGNLFFV